MMVRFKFQVTDCYVFNGEWLRVESCIEYEQLEMKLKRLSLSQLKDMIKTFKCSTTRPCVKKDDFIQLLLGLQAQKTLSGPSMYQLMEKKASQMLGKKFLRGSV